jgi:hypothetical protein
MKSDNLSDKALILLNNIRSYNEIDKTNTVNIVIIFLRIGQGGVSAFASLPRRGISDWAHQQQ